MNKMFNIYVNRKYEQKRKTNKHNKQFLESYPYPPPHPNHIDYPENLRC